MKKLSSKVAAVLLVSAFFAGAQVYAGSTELENEWDVNYSASLSYEEYLEDDLAVDYVEEDMLIAGYYQEDSYDLVSNEEDICVDNIDEDIIAEDYSIEDDMYMETSEDDIAADYVLEDMIAMGYNFEEDEDSIAFAEDDVCFDYVEQDMIAMGYYSDGVIEEFAQESTDYIVDDLDVADTYLADAFN